MKWQENSGLTLVETLVSIAVMGIMLSAAYATIHQSLRLHKQFFHESAARLDRCALAEQLASDVRMNRSLRAPNAARWEVTRSDGARIGYAQLPGKIVRVENGDSPKTNAFEVGKAAISFRGKGAGWRESIPDAETVTAVRLKFGDAELILGR